MIFNDQLYIDSCAINRSLNDSLAMYHLNAIECNRLHINQCAIDHSSNNIQEVYNVYAIDCVGGPHAHPSHGRKWIISCCSDVRWCWRRHSDGGEKFDASAEI